MAQAAVAPVRAGEGRSSLPGMRKAAVLLVALGDEAAKLVYQHLGEAEVQSLTREIAELREVPPATAQEVVQEYLALVETHEHMSRGGIEYATRVLVEAFGKQRATAMLEQVQRMQEASHGNLAMLQKADPQQLAKFLEGEHPQTIALVLAHLDPKRASVVLMHLSPELRTQAVRRLAEMRQFSPEMAQKVALILHQRLQSLGDQGRKAYAGFKAVADLLNRIDPETGRGILGDLERDQPELAHGIRNLMFTFEDLAAMPGQSLRELLGALDKKTLATALRGAQETLRAKIFEGMSSRAAEMLKEDMEALGPLRSKDVAAAQQEVLNVARRMEAEGKIMLKLEGGEEVNV